MTWPQNGHKKTFFGFFWDDNWFLIPIFDRKRPTLKNALIDPLNTLCGLNNAKVLIIVTRSPAIKGSFTYYVITKGGGFRNDYTNVIFALSNAEFDYGRVGLETDKKWLRNMWTAPYWNFDKTMRFYIFQQLHQTFSMKI